MKARFFFQQTVLMAKSKVEPQALDMAIGQIVGDATPVLFKVCGGKTRAFGQAGGHSRQMIEGVIAGGLQLLRQGAYGNGIFLDRFSAQNP